MHVVCPSCFEELAEVKVLEAFVAQLSCGKCGMPFGHSFQPEPARTDAAPAVGVDPGVRADIT